MEIRDRKRRRDRQREGYEDELTMGKIGLELDVRLGQVLASLEDARWSQAGCEYLNAEESLRGVCSEKSASSDSATSK